MLSKHISASCSAIIRFPVIVIVRSEPQTQLLCWRQLERTQEVTEHNLRGIWMIPWKIVYWSLSHRQENWVGCICYKDTYAISRFRASPFPPPSSTGHQSIEMKQFNSLNRATKFSLKMAKLVTFRAKTHWSWVQLSPRLFCRNMKKGSRISNNPKKLGKIIKRFKCLKDCSEPCRLTP